MDKKGAEKYLSPFWFLVLAIVAGGIFAMVYVFYGAPYDVRNIEASVLMNQIGDCVSYSGRIDTSFISNGSAVFSAKTGNDFLKYCHLNFDTSEWNEQQYYTEVTFYQIGDLNNPVLDINAGNNKWVTDCAIQQNKTEENLPQCAKQSFYSLDDSNNQYIIKILSVVRKSEKNIKL